MRFGRVTLLAAAVVAVFLAGVQVGYRRSGPPPPSGSRTISRYICPMHPQYRSDKPGDCPSCGMALVPVFDDGGASGSVSGDSKPASLPPGAFAVSPEKQQVVGIRLAKVERVGGTRTLRSVGRVAADATRVYPVTASVGGWITAAGPYTAGSHVKKGTVLASFYSPEIIASIRALLNVVNSKEWAEKSGEDNPARQTQIYQFSQNLQQTRDALRNQGVGALQVERLIKTRQWEDVIEIPAPANGFILARNIVEGQRFRSGDEFYTIADLSRVWILVDVFEQEEKFLRPGRRVRVTLPRQGIAVSATVSDVLPQFDPTSRTLKIRLEADNAGFRLRPDMLLDVELPISYDPAITVPSDAVLNTGQRQVVFVDIDGGHFEPRRVETGWRADGLTEITGGLAEGERVVASGTFLLDSEARMKYGALGITSTPQRDLVCGMDVDERKAVAAGRTSQYRGQTYYFCADECKKAFDASPAAYAAK